MENRDEDVEKLIQAVGREDLIVFVGAGVSRLVGGPSWDELSKKYLKHLYINKVINYSTYEYLHKQETRKLISICKEIEKSAPRIPQFDISRLLKNPRMDEELKSCSDIHSHLYNLSSIFVTTNFDDHIDKVVINRLNMQKSRQKEVSNSTSNPITYHYAEINSTSLLQNGNVIHIHGSVNDPKERGLVLTITDYFKAYNDGESMLPNFLDTIFNEKTVLFIGYGLEEYEILEYMLNRKRRITDIRHYMLYGLPKEEEGFFNLQESYYANLGVKLIKYNISEIGYRQLYFEVKELASKVGPNAHPKEKLAKLKLVDGIL